VSGRARRFTAAAGAPALFAVAWFALGCQGLGVSRDELPDAALAFVYTDSETARRRAEWLTEERGRAPVDPTGDRAIAEIGEISRYLSMLLGVQGRGAQDRFEGRLALLDARTAAVTLVAGARKGAVPHDWSPDRRRLLFSQVVHDELPSLFEVDVETGEVSQRTHGQRAHPEGCYGPDGRIVYTAVDARSGRRDARIMVTTPGGRAQRLSEAGYAFYPSCAPDGSAVTYTVFSDDGRVPQVVVRSPVLDGEPRVLAVGKEASFSPDGSWIVYSARSHGSWSLWRIRPDGTGRATLGHAGYDEHRPSLSPDNRLVVYVADTKLHQQLYLRRVDGTGDRILLADGDGDRPVW
jgi:Tol biopolymer transport system component